MKLYTKNHILLSVTITACIFILFISGFLIFFTNHNSSQNEINTEETLSQTEVPLSQSNESASQTTNSLTQEFNPYQWTVNYPVTYSQDEKENISVYENYNEAVVNINTQVMAVNWFLEPVPQEGGSGSGSIIDPRGYVVTNVHYLLN